MIRKLTTDEFVTKSDKIHNNFYDYKLFEYINNSTKSIIICPIHGSFEQRPADHMRGQGCKKCYYERKHNQLKKSITIFIEEAINVHGNLYNYSNFAYINNKTRGIIYCRKHGGFEQRPDNHLNGQGCPECKKDTISKSLRSTFEYFRKQAIQIHGSKYDYDNVDYINNHTKVEIVCKKHGIFLQVPNSHLNGSGCKMCSNERNKTNIGGYSNKLFELYPEKKNKHSILYLIELEKDDEHLLKIGITTQVTVYERFRSKNTFNGYKMKCLKTVNGTLFKNFKNEQHLLDIFKAKQRFPSIRFAGWTECISFNYDTKKQIMEFMENIDA